MTTEDLQRVPAVAATLDALVDSAQAHTPRRASTAPATAAAARSTRLTSRKRADTSPAQA